MKKIFAYFFAYLLRFVLWFRYSIRIKGLDKINPKVLNKPGGMLFLPNHPAVLVDPLSVGLALWPKIPVRPLIIEYLYYQTGIHAVMKMVDAVPVPNFDTSSNSLKRKRNEKVLNTVVDNLRHGQSFIIYPAGQLKDTAREIIGGASMVHHIISEVPEVNVVLVRVKGLWGSSFSRAYTGKTPPILPLVWQGFKHCLKNFLFFTPRRKVIIEFYPAPADFPYRASRLEMNRWLEKWYNMPDGLTKQKGEEPGDSFIQVSYSMWGEVYPHIPEPMELPQKEEVPNDKIPEKIRREIIDKIAEITEKNPAVIHPDMRLSVDLGMDSLDMADLISYLQLKYDVGIVPVPELTTVNRVMGIAAGMINVEEFADKDEIKTDKWFADPLKRPIAEIAEGKTIPEVFLNSCDRMGNLAAVADARSGVLTYTQMKLRVILLAEYIRKLPGEYIGILLPSSVAATLLVYATQLAGKVPLMINWTIGPKHLEHVKELSHVQVVLTSWAFIDRLRDVDLTPIEDMLIMLEDEKKNFTLSKKLSALWRSKHGTHSIMKHFGINEMDPNNQAVLLFTSGTESMPKGVPLTHHNLLCNMRGSIAVVEVQKPDVLFGILPPFHAFGFLVGALLAPLAGVRIAYSPNPTDGKKLAFEFERWGITIVCGAPTFIKGIISASQPDQLKTLRLCVSGAEKAPKELFNMFESLGKKGILIEGYGITECSPVITMTRSDKPPRGVGEAIPGVELLIVDPETMQPLPIGSRGLILAKGPNIFSGYINPGIASPFVTLNNETWYKTGDLGFLDELGRLIISGRQKRFVKIGGEMISLAAVEDALMHLAERKEWPINPEGPTLAVIAKEGEGQRTKLYVFAIFEAEIDELNQGLREAGLSNIVRISEFHRVPVIPIMGTGKVNYRELESQYIKTDV
jgi:long-chain-fatty-acid--[acyl-carrier-protein] ligase